MVNKKEIEQTVIRESLKRMYQQVEEDIRSGELEVSMLRDLPEEVRSVVMGNVPVMVALARISLSSCWN